MCVSVAGRQPVVASVLVRIHLGVCRVPRVASGSRVRSCSGDLPSRACRQALVAALGASARMNPPQRPAAAPSKVSANTTGSVVACPGHHLGLTVLSVAAIAVFLGERWTNGWTRSWAMCQGAATQCPILGRCVHPFVGGGSSCRAVEFEIGLGLIRKDRFGPWPDPALRSERIIGYVRHAGRNSIGGELHRAM